MSDSIEQKVVAAIAKSRGIAAQQIKLDTTFEEIGMTSLDSLALIFDLEEEFGISIPNEEAMGLSNVKQATEVVRELLMINRSPENEAGGVIQP